MSRAFPLREMHPFAAPGAPKGKSGAEMYAEHQAVLDEYPTTVRCVFCPGWVFQGTAEQTRAASLQHRVDVHPAKAKVRLGKRARERARAEELARRRALDVLAGAERETA